MKNVSLNGETVNLDPGETYFVIDALYLNDIKNELHNLDKNDLLLDIKEKVFPYTDTPFAEFKADNNDLDIRRFRKVDYTEVVFGDPSFFSTDTGLIILIGGGILSEFISNYDFGELVDSVNDPINLSFWKGLISNFPVSKIALILSPGINSGFDLDGGGTYQIR